MNSSLSYNFKQDVTDVTPNGFVVSVSAIPTSYDYLGKTILFSSYSIISASLFRMCPQSFIVFIYKFIHPIVITGFYVMEVINIVDPK
jgi:hypothetical protein